MPRSASWRRDKVTRRPLRKWWPSRSASIPQMCTLHLGNTDTAPYGMGSRGARGGTAGGGVLLTRGASAARKGADDRRALLGLNSSGELRLRGGRIERRLGGAWTDAGLAVPTLRTSPISTRCACRRAWSQASRRIAPTTRRR